MSEIDRTLLATAATSVLAPLAAAALAWLGGSRIHPRLPAGLGLAVSLVAALGLAWGLRSGPVHELACGPELAGGSLVQLDGLTAILLPLVALVEARSPRRS
jgi:NADH:ubiquinone oxidoreductase subunit 5 (subunit L)/multisubunit Na+/H+ antiporter MnhA subunit